MVVTIDGPAGSGKSTAAKALAGKLDFAYLDTGALYRALGLAAQWDKAGLEHDDMVEAWLTRVDLKVEPKAGRFLVLLDGRDVEPFIRNELIGGFASKLSALAPVRKFLLSVQQEAGEKGDLVAEGRDMGTVVFPRAEVKFFITASDRERAKRRLKDLLPDNPSLTLEDVLEQMAERDQRDSSRKLSPLKPAEDAILVDTSSLSPQQVVDFMADEVFAVRRE